jgi:hypothetical protein
MSTGYDRSANAYLWSAETQAGANNGRCFMSPGEDLNARIATEAVQLITRSTTVGKGETCIVTVGWDVTTMKFYIDGAEVATASRDGGYAADIFYNIIIGAQYTGTTDVFNSGLIEEAWISELVVSTLTPAIETIGVAGVSGFGDSFAARFVGVVTNPYYDAKTEYSLPSQVWLATGKTIDVDGAGFSGATICDTGSNNLNDEFGGFLTTYTNPNVVIMAGNNDAIATDGEVDNVTTGTAARLSSWLDQLLADGRKRVFVATPGSLIYDNALDTALNNTRRKRIEGIIRETVATWVEANGLAMEVRIMPLIALLGGEYEQNMNYVGFTNTVGNLGSGGSAAPAANPDDRHPSPEGWTCVNSWIYQGLNILPVSLQPTGPLAFNDRVFRALRDMGYTGSLPDMTHQFFIDQGWT